MAKTEPRVYKFASNGFTIIEILIVVAIIGIIAAVAIPAYTEQVERGKRADGKAFLLDIVSRQERFFSQYVSYTSVLGKAGACTGADCGLGMGGGNKSPEEHYTAAITTGPGTCAPGGTSCRTYTITVTSTSGDPKCTTLTYDHTGRKGSTGTGSVEECWR